MRLPEFGVRYPITNIMIFFAILVLGLVSLYFMSIDLMPEIEPPAVSVITRYEGASAEDVETKVTEVIENRVSIVSNLDKLTSRSIEGFSIVTAQFEWGTNLDEASNEIRDQIEFAKRFLPEDIETPIVFKFSTSMIPIIFYGITAFETYPKLYDLIDDEVASYLKRIPEVGAIQLVGGLERQINVKLHKDKLEAYHLSVEDITNTLAAENITFPAGEIKAGFTEHTLRVPGEFKTPQELNDVIVGQHNGALVYLKDIADVEDSFKEQTMIARCDQKSALIMIIQKRSGANTVDAAKKIKKELEVLKKRLPPDVGFTLVMDTSDFIVQAIDNLSKTIYWGGIFVILTVWFFLRQIWPSFIIATTIPFSLVITFIFMYLFGFTINIMSLSSLAIAIGMVVDNAIVIVDNVFRHKESGEKIREAAIYGTSEVMLAVSASTLTTVAVFIPMMFLSGITGIMFKQLSSMVIIAILASLFTAFTFTPMLCSKLLANPLKAPSGRKAKFSWFYDRSEMIFKKIEEGYGQILGWALRHKKLVLISALLIFVFTLALIPKIGIEFIPEEDTGTVTVNAELAIGTRVEQTDRVARQIEKIFKDKIPEMESMFCRAGQTTAGFGMAFVQKQGSHVVTVGAKLVKKNERQRSVKEIAQAVRKEIVKIPEVLKISIEAGDPFARLLLGGGKPLTIEILGHDIERTNELAYEIKGIMEKTSGVVDPTISRDIGKPELQVKIDRQKASSLGLNVSQITETVRTFFYGKSATRYREAGNEYDIFVRLREEDRKGLSDLRGISIKSKYGNLIRLDNVASIVQGIGPLEIERKDQARIVKVEANIYGRSIGRIAEDINKQMKKLQIPPEIIVKFSGDIEEQKESFRDLTLVLILSVLLVYMVMAAQFESLIDPFIILFSIPFGVSGVLLALFMTNITLSVASFVGVIMLSGIVVNNAIVLISYINILRARGLPMIDAVRTGGKNRLRPILMTTLTTVFGMFPLAISRGEGSETWNPLGISMIGGLTFSTIVTLVLIPVFYAIFEQRIKKNNRKG